jgi:hypothetical protein
MNKIDNIIEILSKRNKFEFYGAFFRIFICFHLIKDLFYTWEFIPVVYGGKAFYSSQPTYLLEFFGLSSDLIREHINVFIFFYVLLILFFLFGIGKNLTALFLFLSLEIVQRLCHVLLNGGDNLLKFCLLYMVFLDSYKYFSLSSKSLFKHKILNNFLSNLAGYSICIHLCIVYFFSALHKIHSDVWFNGIATYYTLSLERFKGSSLNSYIANNGILVTITTYSTLLIEISYPFLIWFQKSKKLCILLAIAMHLGIYWLMMIYDFQIIYIMIQGFFISNDKWLSLLRLTNRLKGKTIFNGK